MPRQRGQGQKHKLTATQVKSKTDRREIGLHSDGGGLYLQLTAGGASWVYRYKVDVLVDGKPKKVHSREMGLGSLNNVTLAQARQTVEEYRQQADPIEERNAKRLAAALEKVSGMTFRQCAERYIRAHSSSWSNAKHAGQWPSSLEDYAYPVFGDLPVKAINTDLVMLAVEPIWQSRPETASRVRGRIEAVLDWATARGFRPRTEANPARWRGHLEHLLAKRVRGDKHHSAIAYAELPSFMVKLRKHDAISARALEFLVLTASRTSEVIGARWAEINFDERLWTVPGERMKAGKEHRVPLSDRAVEILRDMAAVGPYVFLGNRRGGLSPEAMKQLLRQMRPGVTVHGFRSTFSDWCAEQTDFSSEVREMALAHAVSDRVEAAYRRGDLFGKRRALAEAWANYCGTESSNVVRLAVS